jgi:hypothetical protein
MVEWKRVDGKLFLIQNAASIAAWKFLDSQFERELEVGGSKRRIEESPEPFGPENVQWRFAPVQMKSTEQAGNAVKMISVKMADENGMDTAALYAGSHELELSALAAIE